MTGTHNVFNYFHILINIYIVIGVFEGCKMAMRVRVKGN